MNNRQHNIIKQMNNTTQHNYEAPNAAGVEIEVEDHSSVKSFDAELIGFSSHASSLPKDIDIINQICCVFFYAI